MGVAASLVEMITEAEGLHSSLLSRGWHLPVMEKRAA